MQLLYNGLLFCKCCQYDCAKVFSQQVTEFSAVQFLQRDMSPLSAQRVSEERLSSAQWERSAQNQHRLKWSYVSVSQTDHMWWSMLSMSITYIHRLKERKIKRLLAATDELQLLTTTRGHRFNQRGSTFQHWETKRKIKYKNSFLSDLLLVRAFSSVLFSYFGVLSLMDNVKQKKSKCFFGFTGHKYSHVDISLKGITR